MRLPMWEPAQRGARRTKVGVVLPELTCIIFATETRRHGCRIYFAHREKTSMPDGFALRHIAHRLHSPAYVAGTDGTPEPSRGK